MPASHCCAGVVHRRSPGVRFPQAARADMQRHAGAVTVLCMDSPNVGQIRNDVDALYEILGDVQRVQAEHTATLEDHTATLRDVQRVQTEHTATLEDHTATLAEHTATLKNHTVTLAEHTAKFAEHDGRFDRIEAMLVELLRRVPPQD